MTLIPFQLSQLDKLCLKPPPAELFEELLGYAGVRRWVGFYYQYGCLYHTAGDGIAAGNWQPWLIWHWSLGHEIIGRYCFGYDDVTAVDMLVLDRKSRCLYAGKMALSRTVLRQQIPHAQEKGVLEPSREHLERLKEEFRTRLLQMGTQEYVESTKRLQDGVEKLQLWLKKGRGESPAFTA